jgi:hypothetical protein
MPELLSDVTARLIHDRRGRLIVRAAVCHLLAHHHHQTVPEIAKAYYDDDKDLNRVAPFTLTRAAVVPSSMTNVGLVQTIGVSDFNNVIAGVAATPLLWPLGLQLRFDGRGAIAVSAITANAGMAAFTGEGLPIPVEQGALGAIVLVPHKFGGIMSFTRELFEHSIPNIEAVVRSTLSSSYGLSMDAAALGAVAGDGVVTAGLRFGIAGLPPATITGAITNRSEAMVADVEQMVAQVGTVAGNAPIVFVCSPAQTAALKMLPNFPYTVLASPALPLKTCICIASNSLVSAMDPVPRFEISREATMVMDDSAPVALSTSPGVFGSPIRSNWQTDTISLRMIAEVSWGIRNPLGLAHMSPVLW